ncbi:carbohydrate ABC transporter permease [Atribacter laminatus]|jgi:multiple sugar transport system permease protein|uniref:Inner membrane ABC transporter permease protein YcjO n=1 Tax=Atribacter laminatus TaxID=2847778 RepID=A0A7T1AN11_ATRLM|nr:sugar ABC transporter permease [Atribacter laminatus]QPM68922.1 Inner membrane ABC transporter permease protein YcjO [Atribacter laminatus]
MSRAGKFWTTESRLAYLLLIPSAVFLIVFMFYPIFYVFLMSFFKVNKLANLTGFFGMGNYITLFKLPEFWQIIIRSCVWTALAVTAKTVIGLIIALLLNVDFRGRKLARTLIIIPWASSIPISAMLWQWTYNNDFGLLNYTLRWLGLNPPVWLAYPLSAFMANLWVDIWCGIPFMALVFLAGLQAIPQELYEAAEVDGATSISKFRFVTLPLLSGVLTVATLLSILWTFNDFNVIYILTKGGPANSTDILITYIYKYAFQYIKFGPSAAMAVITFAILLTVSIIYARNFFREGAQ